MHNDWIRRSRTRRIPPDASSRATPNYSRLLGILSVVAFMFVALAVTAQVTAAPLEPSFTQTLPGQAGQANLGLTKTGSPNPVAAGGQVNYTLTVNNSGPGAASSVALTDTLPANTTFVGFTNPAGWTCTRPAVGSTGTVSCVYSGTLPVGSPAVFNLVVQVNSTVPAGTIINNTAVVTSPSDTTPANNQAVAPVTVEGGVAADLSLAKAASPSTVAPGEQISYTLTLNNPGPGDATGVVLTDTVPANTTFVGFTNPPGWTCSRPPVGSVGTVSCWSTSPVPTGPTVFTMVVQVNSTVPGGTNINNTAVFSAPQDTNQSNNVATAVVTVGQAQNADIAVTKTAPATVTAGSVMTYQLGVNNVGSSAASNVVLTDTLPANVSVQSVQAPAGWTCNQLTGTVVCTNPSVAAGATETIWLVVQVNANTPNGTILTNTATASTSTP